MATLEQKAKEARLKVLDMIYKAKSSHIGSNFSCIDILTVLFDKYDKQKDIIVLSAGWKAAAFYFFLADQGYFPKEELDTYNQENSRLIGLTEPGVPGVVFAGGSMQMGLPAAVGFALAMKMKGEEGTVYCLVSDGELAGGMIWESMLIARQHNLYNLVLIIDDNFLQAMGRRSDILDVDAGFLRQTAGVGLIVSDGHDLKKIKEALGQPRGAFYILSFHTIKGKGVSFMENNNLYHYKDLSEEEYLKAKQELYENNI